MIDAAGTVPWRRHQGHLEVALVHRPRYDDWSWPKGKVDPGEPHVVAAARETLEETSYRAHVGRPLPQACYTVLDKSGQPSNKNVHYWAAKVSGGGKLINEIDEVAWVDAVTAHARLDYARDQDQLLAVVRADQEGTLDTWPLIVVRHAHAVSRSDFDGDDDRQRPLDAVGEQQATALAPVLAAYAVERLVTSSSTRCVQTLTPYAAALGGEFGHSAKKGAAKADAAKPLPDKVFREKDDLSEEGFAADPDALAHRVARLLRKPIATAVCSHGPVLPSLLAEVHDRLSAHPDAATHTEGDGEVLTELEEIAKGGLTKGEALVLHLIGHGKHARLVALERHRPQTNA